MVFHHFKTRLMDERNNEFLDLQLAEGGERYSTLATKKFLERKRWEKPNPKAVLSIIPGSVTSIGVKVGDKVKKGDPLMTYEAMKMQNVVVAPLDGEICKINVKEGDKLPKGHLLIELK